MPGRVPEEISTPHAGTALNDRSRPITLKAGGFPRARFYMLVGLSGLCAALAMAVPVSYLAAGLRGGDWAPESSHLINWVSPLVQLVINLFVIPLFLVLQFRSLLEEKPSPIWWGVTGLILGMWSLSVLIMVPYLGGYPSLLFMTIHALLLGKPGVWDTRFWLSMYLMNLTVWPALAMLLGRVLRAKTPTNGDHSGRGTSFSSNSTTSSK